MITKEALIEHNNIYNIDCMEGMKLLPNECIDCIVTDPPYGVGFSKGFDDSKEHIEENISLWLKEMYRILKPGCHCYIFIPTKEAAIWLTEISKTFNLNNILSTRTYTTSLYLKNNFQFNSQLIAYCSKGTAKRLNAVDFIRTSPSWLKDKRNKNPKEYTYSYPAFIQECFSNTKICKNSTDRHPCEKNPELIEFFIKLSSNEDDIIFDPFVGGGSTMIAAKNTGRNFLGFELSEEYYNLAKNKLLF